MAQETINQRINFLVLHFTGGNKSAFARTIGITSQGLGEILGGRQSAPSFSVLQSIFSAYPQVSADWLLLGKGEMLRDSQGLSSASLSTQSQQSHPNQFQQAQLELLQGQVRDLQAQMNLLVQLLGELRK